MRLLLIPLCLYAIMHFFFWGIIAAIAGFAVFGCGIFLEGMFERLSKAVPGNMHETSPVGNFLNGYCLTPSRVPWEFIWATAIMPCRITSS